MLETANHHMGEKNEYRWLKGTNGRKWGRGKIIFKLK